MYRTFLFTAALLIFVASTPARAAEIETKLDVEYGSAGDEKLLLDLAYPKELKEPVPAIVFIHGGGWQAGSRKAYSGQIEAVAKLGYVVASVSYRLAPKHKFPAQIEDCKCAIRWLRANAEELHLDPDRIGAIGHSAGAHLSMLLGTMDREDGLEGDGGSADHSSKVQAVVAYFGPTDLLAPYPETSQPILDKFIGPKEEFRDQYRRASPVTYVNAGDAPMLLFQGTKDPLVPHDQAVRMADSLTSAGVAGRVELILGAGHGWGNPDAERTQRDAMAFFQQVLQDEK